jgi:hypothetical protein
MRPAKKRPSPALLVAVIALVAALAGTATALPGKKTIDKNDFKKGAVTKKAIKAGAVTTKAVKDGGIGAVDLTPDEPFHKVDAPGEPTFGDGGENDCIWSNTPPDPGASVNPAAFYMDKGGRVHLAGVVESNNGPGGDGACDATTESDDARVFTLPPAYRPENVEFSTFGTLAVLVVGDEDAVVVGGPAESGSVLIVASGPSLASLDGISFRAAGPGDNGLTPASAKGARSSEGVLEALLAELGN